MKYTFYILDRCSKKSGINVLMVILKLSFFTFYKVYLYLSFTKCSVLDTSMIDRWSIYTS